MAWREVAGTCENGPCPTIYIDDVTRNVRIRGNKTDAHVPMPDFEDMVEIPAADWTLLLAQLRPLLAP